MRLSVATESVMEEVNLTFTDDEEPILMLAVKIVDAQWREGYGEPPCRWRRPNGDQHVVPRQQSEQPHDRRSSKFQGASWKVH